MATKDHFEQENWYKDFLTADEQVKWTGKPENLFSFSPVYIVLIPFLITWFGGVITALISILVDVLRGESHPAFLLVMVPFLTVGSYFVYMLFIRPVKRRKYTRYAITNKRLLEYYRGNINTLFISSFTPVRMSSITRRGTASITVGTSFDDSGLGGDYVRIPFGRNGTIEIMDISDPRKVYNMIVNNGEK